MDGATRQTVSAILLNKPEDASDIGDIEKAKEEIIALRRLAKTWKDALKGRWGFTTCAGRTCCILTITSSSNR